MEFNDYQKQSTETAIYPDKGANLVYPALKLAGEAGEVAEKIGKLMRDNHYQVGMRWDFFNGFGLDTLTATTDWEDMLVKELGDVLWYISAIATELGINLDHVAKANIEKLASRKERGVLGGSGDNR